MLFLYVVLPSNIQEMEHGEPWCYNEFGLPTGGAKWLQTILMLEIQDGGLRGQKRKQNIK